MVKCYNSIIDLKDLWENLTAGSTSMSVFQSYEWNKLSELNFYRQRFYKYVGCCINYITLDERIILPCVVNRRHKLITFLGQDEATDYFSPIFNKLEKNDIIALLNYLKDKYKGYSLLLDRINEQNPTTLILQELADDGTISSDIVNKECVLINTQTNTDTFYESLSKSARQNYRTAKNRLSKAGWNYNIETSERIINLNEAESLYELYKERRSDCANLGKLKSWTIKTTKHILHLFNMDKIDVFSEYSKSNPTFISIIRINGDIAAFCEGCYESEERITVIRVATKADYYSYSPGQILLIETLEAIKDKVKIFDLTRGTEDYKFKLGGQMHYNYCYNIKL